MARSAKASPKRAGRVAITVERIVLGALMSAAVYLVERRLKKAFASSPESGPDLFDKSVRIRSSS